jgi:hypothetical protein
MVDLFSRSTVYLKNGCCKEINMLALAGISDVTELYSLVEEVPFPQLIPSRPMIQNLFNFQVAAFSSRNCSDRIEHRGPTP